MIIARSRNPCNTIHKHDKQTVDSIRFNRVLDVYSVGEKVLDVKKRRLRK